MKRSKLLMLIWLVSFGLLQNSVFKAETKVPCLIFSGNAEKEHSIDLAKLNRITFGDNSMIVTSKDDSNQSVELQYSLYHHLEIGDVVPTDLTTGVETANSDYNSNLYFDNQDKQLHLQSTSETKFSIGVFDISGHLLLTSKLKNGDALTLEALSPGVYIAVASDGKTKIYLKFILN